jgi:hypothetical protein
MQLVQTLHLGDVRTCLQGNGASISSDCASCVAAPPGAIVGLLFACCVLIEALCVALSTFSALCRTFSIVQYHRSISA